MHHTVPAPASAALFCDHFCSIFLIDRALLSFDRIFAPFFGRRRFSLIYCFVFFSTLNGTTTNGKHVQNAIEFLRMQSFHKQTNTRNRTQTLYATIESGCEKYDLLKWAKQQQPIFDVENHKLFSTSCVKCFVESHTKFYLLPKARTPPTIFWEEKKNNVCMINCTNWWNKLNWSDESAHLKLYTSVFFSYL